MMMFQGQGKKETSARHQNNNRCGDNYFGGTAEGNSNEWLNSSLGRKEDFADTERHYQQKSSSNKAFLCNFCRRQFYSSQALGGHQNAHRRERGAVRRYQCERQMAVTGLFSGKPVASSLGVQPHSLVHKPVRDLTHLSPIIARFNDDAKEDAVACTATVPKEATRVEWPQSFRMVSEQPKQSELLKIDLTLHL